MERATWSPPAWVAPSILRFQNGPVGPVGPFWWMDADNPEPWADNPSVHAQAAGFNIICYPNKSHQVTYREPGSCGLES